MNERLEQDFAWYLQVKYRLKPEDVEPTETQGYWQIKEPCGGLAGGCRNELHRTVFNEGPAHHTVRYVDGFMDERSRRDTRGRFISPYTTWRHYREANQAKRRAEEALQHVPF